MLRLTLWCSPHSVGEAHVNFRSVASLASRCRKPRGAIPQVVRGGSNGELLLTWKRDRFVRAIKKLLDAPELRRNLEKLGRALSLVTISSWLWLKLLESVHLERLEPAGLDGTELARLCTK